MKIKKYPSPNKAPWKFLCNKKSKQISDAGNVLIYTQGHHHRLMEVAMLILIWLFTFVMLPPIPFELLYVLSLRP